MVDGACGIIAVLIGLTRRKTRQQCQPLIDGLDRYDAEPFLRSRSDDVVAQHQVLDITRRDDHALSPGEAGNPARVEKPFNLLVYAADRLDSTELVDRT